MTAARTVFLGSGPFAVPLAAALLHHPHVALVCVVTAPPRPAGRGRQVRPSPIATWAAETDVPVLAPEQLRSDDSTRRLEAIAPDLLVLADYGQIVPRRLLELPPRGALNLHPSLLPRHRGASPIPASILAGDHETGVTLMRMDEGLDTGPIVAQRRVPLTGTERAPELERRLALEAAELLAGTLEAWLEGGIDPSPQADEGATLTRPLRRADGRLDPSASVADLERRVRAYQPWPGAYLETPLGRIAVRAAQPVAPAGAPTPDPGTLVDLRPGLALAAADGLLELLEVQPAGGRTMSGAELLRGRPGLIGPRAGASPGEAG